MRLHNLHSWRIGAAEARELQSTLALRVSCHSSLPSDVRRIAGTDISPPDFDGTVRAAVVVLEYPSLQMEEVILADGQPGMSYVPGLLSFRETLTRAPDLIIVDGQGQAHPRAFGAACHVGLITDTPTIGCAKSRLTGKHDPLPGEAGSRAELINKGQVVGMAVRTRTDVSPVFVSVGHKIDLNSAVEWVLACCKGRRIPETTRLAHQAAAGRLAATPT